MNHREIEEIDVIELFLVLWKNKVIICMLAITGVSGRRRSFVFGATKHQSIITVNFGQLPDGVDKSTTLSDFSNFFFDPEVFGAWKSEADNVGFEFDDIASSHRVGQFTVFRPTSTRLAFVDDELHAVVINSKNLPAIQSVFEYTNFASGRLAIAYAKDVRSTLEFMTKTLPNESMQLQGSFTSLLSLQGYLRKNVLRRSTNNSFVPN